MSLKSFEEGLNTGRRRIKEMLLPFKKKKSQKNYGIISTILGIVIMLANPEIPIISDYITTLFLGIIIATLGVIYLLEAVS